jgi:transposase-like protein
MNEEQKSLAGVGSRPHLGASAKQQMLNRSREMRELGQSRAKIALELGVSEQSLRRWTAQSEGSSSKQALLPVAMVESPSRPNRSGVVMRLGEGREIHGLSVEELARLLKLLSAC